MFTKIREVQFIVAANSSSTGNPAFDGWVPELDVLLHIRKNLMTNKIRVRVTGGSFSIAAIAFSAVKRSSLGIL